MFRDNDDSTRSQINSAYYSNAVVDQRNIARNQNKKITIYNPMGSLH